LAQSAKKNISSFYKATANAISTSAQFEIANAAVPEWIDDFCSVQIYNTDLSGTYQWKTSGTDCNTPQCGLNGAQGGDTLVDPITNPSVDFSEYPAQNACRAFSGRLPTQSETACIYLNQVSLGSLQIGDYWTNAEYSSMGAWLQNSYGNGTNLAGKFGSFYVHCVRTAPISIPTPAPTPVSTPIPTPTPTSTPISSTTGTITSIPLS